MQTHDILITKEPTPLVGTIDEFPKSDWTYARGHPASTDLLALPIRSLAVTDEAYTSQHRAPRTGPARDV